MVCFFIHMSSCPPEQIHPVEDCGGCRGAGTPTTQHGQAQGHGLWGAATLQQPASPSQLQGVAMPPPPAFPAPSGGGNAVGVQQTRGGVQQQQPLAPQQLQALQEQPLPAVTQQHQQPQSQQPLSTTAQQQPPPPPPQQQQQQQQQQQEKEGSPGERKRMALILNQLSDSVAAASQLLSQQAQVGAGCL